MGAASNAEEDFDVWANLSARLRVCSIEQRRALLVANGLEERWERIHEAWARVLNQEIAAGKLERPERYLALCAREEQLGPPRAAAATLPGLLSDDDEDAMPFTARAPKAGQGAGAASNSTSAAASFFAELRATTARIPPPPPRAHAETLPVIAEPAAPMGPPPKPTSADECTGLMSTSERFLADFRASLMPPSSVAEPGAKQLQTLVPESKERKK